MKYLLLILFCVMFHFLIYLLLRFCLSFALNSFSGNHSEKINRGNVIFSDIDWHDYEYLLHEANRTGLGEHGVAAEAPESQAKEVARQTAIYGYNGYLSDLIALNRSVADIRPSE